MTRDELVQLLEYDPEENERLFMPNEIFEDFPKFFPDSSSRVAFAYSFYYLTAYLYRFCKYGNTNGRRRTTGTIKEILGYSNTYKGVDDIIKRHGILDTIGYTESTTDYPGYWELDDDDGLVFFTYGSFDSNMKSWMIKHYGRPPIIKKPLKGFTRDKAFYSVTVGTFFVFEHTTRIPFEVFLLCMANQDLGTVGFYVYSFLKYQCEGFGGEFVDSLNNFAQSSGIKKSKLTQQLRQLEVNGMIEVDHQEYDSDETQRQPNRYRIKDWHEFADATINA